MTPGPLADSLDSTPPNGAVLAFDAASPVASAAVAQSGRLLASRALPGSRSSGVLLALLEGVLSDAGLRPATLAGVVALAGPGSFTGTRVALATALGLRLGGVPRATAVSSLEVLALAAPERFRRPLAVVDALRGDWFVQPFVRAAAGTLASGAEPRLQAATEPLPGGCDALVGFGAGALALAHAPLVGFEPEALAPAAALAASLGRWGWEESTLRRPLYLRPPAARRPA